MAPSRRRPHDQARAARVAIRHDDRGGCGVRDRHRQGHARILRLRRRDGALVRRDIPHKVVGECAIVSRILPGRAHFLGTRGDRRVHIRGCGPLKRCLPDRRCIQEQFLDIPNSVSLLTPDATNWI